MGLRRGQLLTKSRQNGVQRQYFPSLRMPPHPLPTSERLWLELLEAYLPKRYRAASGFVINAEGRRSRQIDIVIYDELQSPPLFPHAAGVHLPVESVYGVFEVKTAITGAWLKDAGEKAASVRELQAEGSFEYDGVLTVSDPEETLTLSSFRSGRSG